MRQQHTQRAVPLTTARVRLSGDSAMARNAAARGKRPSRVCTLSSAVLPSPPPTLASAPVRTILQNKDPFEYVRSVHEAENTRVWATHPPGARHPTLLHWPRPLTHPDTPPANPPATPLYCSTATPPEQLLCYPTFYSHSVCTVKCGMLASDCNKLCTQIPGESLGRRVSWPASCPLPNVHRARGFAAALEATARRNPPVESCLCNIWGGKHLIISSFFVSIFKVSISSM